MSQPVTIAYLEISPRQTGKTTRLAKMACALVEAGKSVVFVVHNRRFASELSQRYSGLTVISDGQRLPPEIDPNLAVWFYDEFDFLKSTAIREGAYYATTAARLRVPGRDGPDNDMLMQLVKANGNHHERHLWALDMSDFISESRHLMTAECFRRSVLGEFLS